MTIGPVTSGTDELAPTDTELAAGQARIEGRSLGRIAWNRLKKDRVAMAGGIFVVFLIVVAVLAPLIVKWLGHPPNEFHERLIDDSLQTAKGKYAGQRP
jgi:carbon starvation protein CstA